MQIDILKSPDQNLLDLINVTNTLTLTPAQVAFGAPVSVGLDSAADNTTVAVSAVALGGYTGSVTITYRRLLLNAAVVNAPTNIGTSGTTTLAEFKTAAATALNVLESEFEVTGELPDAFGEVTTMTLTPNATSLLYVGPLEIFAEWSDELSSVITITTMTGFDPAA